jgi:hypothetical protein
MKSARLACLFATVVSTLVLAQSNSSQLNGLPSAQAPGAKLRIQRRESTDREQVRHTSDTRRAHKKGKGPSGNPIGLVSASQIPVGLPCDGYPDCASSQSPFPAALGNFTGVPNVATVVKTHHPVGWAISVEVPNLSDGFTPILTNIASTTNEYEPLLVGSLLGDGVADLVLVHHLSGTYEVFLNARNGSGDFQSQGVVSVTSNEILGGTLSVDANTGFLDMFLVDAANPGNVYTLLGNGDGTFQPATSTPLSIQLSAKNPFNTAMFANFAAHTDGTIDLAANAASNNQVNIFIANSGSYNTGVPLNTPDGTYLSYSNAVGDLSTTAGPPDLVSANYRRNNITIYVNYGAGAFAQGEYYPVQGGPVGISIGDVNNDGFNDVVSVNAQSGDIASLLGNGDGTVQPESHGFVTGGSPQVPAVLTDLNGDGNLDALVLDDEYSFAYLQGNGDGTFISGRNYYAMGGNGLAKGFTIASGDFNGDGLVDFVIGNTNAGLDAAITVFLSNPDASMQQGVNYYGGVTANLEYVAVADFNGDGIPDIAATDSVNGGIQIFTGNGDGTFSVGPTFASDQVSASALGIVAMDFNGDGMPDIAVVNNPSTSTADVGVLLNNSSGGSVSFASPVNYPLSNVASEITAGNLESGQTIVVPLYGTNSNPGTAVATFLGNGDGTFQPESDVSLTSNGVTYYNPYAPVIGDLNGDGIPDITVTIDDLLNKTNQSIALLLGNANGSFQPPTSLPATLQDPSTGYPFPAYLQIGDINGDGIPDLVYSNSNFGTVGVLFGQGGGAFDNPIEYPAGNSAFGVALSDIIGNGTTDVVATGNTTDFSGVTVLLNANPGSLPGLTFNPTSVNFGNEGIGFSSSPLMVILTNSGQATLFLTSIQITGTNRGDFSQSNNCPSYLTPNGSCQINVIFTPTGSGNRNAAISVADNGPGSPQTVPLTGVGVPGTATFSPTSLTFSTQLIATTSPSQPVQLTNTGSGILKISTISVTGPFNQTNNCPHTLSPNASCTFNLKFRPTNKNTQNGSLNVTDNGPGSPQHVALTGTGTWVQLVPGKINFGNQTGGKKSKPKDITMTNKGSGPVNISSIMITGTDASSFSETNNCHSKLSSKAHCTIKVVFDPQTTGGLSADVSVTDDGGGSPQNVSLSGTGT